MAQNLKAIARRIARKYRIPEDIFLRLISFESRWNPSAVSPAGATGLTQLMPGTAKELGVNPRDPIQNLTGGARYLAQQYKRFGSWRLALAAYNAGPGRVEDGSWKKIAETTKYVQNVLGGADVSAPMPTTPEASTALSGAFTGIPELGRELAGDIAAGEQFDPLSHLQDLMSLPPIEMQTPTSTGAVGTGAGVSLQGGGGWGGAQRASPTSFATVSVLASLPRSGKRKTPPREVFQTTGRARRTLMPTTWVVPSSRWIKRLRSLLAGSGSSTAPVSRLWPP